MRSPNSEYHLCITLDDYLPNLLSLYTTSHYIHGLYPDNFIGSNLLQHVCSVVGTYCDQQNIIDPYHLNEADFDAMISESCWSSSYNDEINTRINDAFIFSESKLISTATELCNLTSTTTPYFYLDENHIDDRYNLKLGNQYMRLKDALEAFIRTIITDLIDHNNGEWWLLMQTIIHSVEVTAIADNYIINQSDIDSVIYCNYIVRK